MKNLINLLMLALTISLIQSCSSLQSSQDPLSCTPEKIEIKTGDRPDIPFNPDSAFFPLRVNPQGKIVPSYLYRECVKKFVVCLQWRDKILYFEELEWFYAGEYGLMKRPGPRK